MVKVLEGKISKSDLKTIDSLIVNNVFFPWYWLEKPVTNKYPCMSHIIIPRYNYETNEGFVINSSCFDFFQSIFNKFCKSKKIQVNRILRAQLNLTWNFTGIYSSPHVDHDFKHQVCIMYLNDCTEGSTFLFEEKHPLTEGKNIVKEIKSQKGKIVVFPGENLHAAGFPKKENERRIICIFSFD
jgi:hypothetical protein